MDARFDLSDYLFSDFPECLESYPCSSTQLLEISTQQLIPKTETSERFDNPISSTELKERQKNAVPKKTRQSNNWAVTLWTDWAESRNAKFETALEPGFPIPLDVGKLTDMPLLNYWMQRFIVEIKRKDGQFYPPATLVQIVSAIQRYLKTEYGVNDINFLKEGDTNFADFRKTLDARMKELTGQGIGVNTKRADPVTKQDETTLWTSGVFSVDTAIGLSNAVFFYNGKVFGLRGFSEHIECQAEQFEFGHDHMNNRRYIQFTPRIRKNNQGGLKHKRINNDPVIHYDQPENKTNIYNIYRKYLDHIPRMGPLYRKPLGGVDENNNLRYGCATITQNTLRQNLKRFFEDAGISTDGRNISNHSARVSLCTTLYNERFNDKSVTSRSKHRSSAVQVYQREQFGLLDDISNALEPPLSKSTTDESKLIKGEVKSSSTEQFGSTSTIQSDPAPISLERKESCSNQDLTVFVPECVKKVIIVKDGKKVAIDI